MFQDGHTPGKPGKVGEFESGKNPGIWEKLEKVCSCLSYNYYYHCYHTHKDSSDTVTKMLQGHCTNSSVRSAVTATVSTGIVVFGHRGKMP